MALSFSWNQKINTKSMTETELVGVDDALGYILWTCYFMIEQGCDMDPSLLYQDSISAILLETKGRSSSSKKTWHMKVKYFIIKDKVDWEEITIKHCPTEQARNCLSVMGIPADYNKVSFAIRCNFRPPNWVPESLLMLPIPKDWVAAQECIGGDTKGTEPTTAKVRFAVDVEVCAEPIRWDHRAPMKMVSGGAWSLGIYQALGKTLDMAWERAFIHPFIFN